MNTNRCQTKRRPFTAEDQRALEMMRRCGMPLQVIGEVLERPLSTLKKRCGPMTPSASPEDGVPRDDRDLRSGPGITQDDLAWMRHYRDQARANRRRVKET